MKGDEMISCRQGMIIGEIEAAVTAIAKKYGCDLMTCYTDFDDGKYVVKATLVEKQGGVK